MDIAYATENVFLATREYKNWLEAIIAIVTKREFKKIILRNGFQIEASQEFKWLMNQIFYKKVYTPIPQLQIGKDDIVMDIGAHCGVFTLYAASLTKNTIYSFEPSPDNYRFLEGNIRKNGLKNVLPFNLALDGQTGTANFLINRMHHQENLLHYDHLKPDQLIPQKIEEYEKVTVQTTTLQDIMDEHQIERIDFLKLDCQGAEGPILETTSQSYLRRINKIAMEYHDHISRLKHQDLQKILEEAGFTTLLKKADGESPLGFLYGWRA